MTQYPTVSCIMITRNRRRFVALAIWYFLRQDYPSRQLVVVDDGEDSIADLIPQDGRIRYIRLEQCAPLGTRRNIACRQGSGELIAHWDDDTWYSTRRLSSQVVQFCKAGAEIGYLTHVLHYQPVTGQVWHYDAAGQVEAWLYSNSLIYRRSYWQTCPFPETHSSAVSHWMRTGPSRSVFVQDGSSLMVTLVHGGSSNVPNPADPRWQRRSFPELSRVLEADLECYAGQRTDVRPLAPTPLTLAATFMVYDGYGSMAEYLALGMARAGAEVQILPFRIDATALSAEFQALWQRSRPNPQGIVLCHAWWGENLARFGSAQELFIKTVWETSRLPADWPARLNRATAVIVPSQFTAQVLRASGVTVPIEVVYEGIDPDIYRYQERAERFGLTTLVVGVLAPRKNIQAAVAAWKSAFADDPQARLIIKARFQLQPFVPDDPRIQVVDTNDPTRGIARWYYQADVLLALGNEGFGLPLVEGMATGLPVVALDSEAQAEICTQADGLVLPVRPARWEEVQDPSCGPCGVRAIPSVADAARQLRWVAEHRREARVMGQGAAAWAREQRNVWNMGPAVLDVMERHLRSTRPLRRTWALWTPGNAGGLEARFYAAQLAAVTAFARLHEQPCAAWRAQTLHVQHSPNAVDEVELAQQLQRARQKGIPVLVTEHAVAETAAAWEQQADVLVASTRRGVERLKARWPHKQVELLLPGCHPWRPARRPRRGRTLAVIGQPALKQGLSPLLAALRAHSGTELLVFTPSPPCEQELQALPVRWTALPSADAGLLEQLGTAADVVVFWYDDSPYVSTSYFARIALASGVPVLSSRAAVFADLAGAVFQPEDLAAGLEELLTHPALGVELADAARAYCEKTPWKQVAEQHLALWRMLISA